MKIQINDTNYSYYKKISEIIASHLFKLNTSGPLKGIDPMETLNSWELKSKTLAKRGLKIGLQDLISQIKEFPQELRIAIDIELLANHLPSLAQLQGNTEKTVSKVLKRMQIKSLEEFYIIKEEVIDLESKLTVNDRKLLDSLLTAFELSKNR